MTGAAAKGHQRFDFARIGKVEYLASGAVRIPARLGRAGVVKYSRGGKVVRELRPPDEVFRADSLSTLDGVWATDLHPPHDKALITPANWKEWAVGFVAGAGRQDGSLIRGSVVVQDAAMIDMVRSGERCELSPGYFCLRMDETPGRYNAETGEYGPHLDQGEPYDVVQREILYNSVGIGPRGWGRQGSEVALRLDGDVDEDLVGILHLDGCQLGDYLRGLMTAKGMSVVDLAKATGILAPAETEDAPLMRYGRPSNRLYVLEAILDGWTERPSDEQLEALAKALEVDLDQVRQQVPADLLKLDAGGVDSTRAKKPRMADIELKLDGMTVTLSNSAAEIVKKVVADRDALIADKDAKIATLEQAASASQARLDGVTEQLGDAKKKLEELPSKLREEAAARAKLETQAQKVLGAEARFDGADNKPLSDRAVQELVLNKLAKDKGVELTLDGRDDVYVRARFDYAMEDFKPATATSTAIDAALGGRNPKVNPRQDASDGPDPEGARKRMLEKQNNAWKDKQPAA